MSISLLFNHNKYVRGSVGLVTFDTMISEEHKFTSRVTYYPVESGTIVSDHILLQPDTVILNGVVSDTPLNILASYNRSIAAFQALLYLFYNRQVVTVVTGIQIYRNMAITTLDVPRTIQTGQTLNFNITLQRIIYADTVQVLTDPNNVFSGVQDSTPSDIVAENTNIPLLMNDPPFSLKDQASSRVSVGVQSLNSLPAAVLPNILGNLIVISGL